MSKVINRFWDWIFHPSVRKFKHPQSKALNYRYPAPGNAKLESVMNEKQPDYKTPYEHSHYNVRYEEPTPMQTSEVQVHVRAAPLVADAIMRLKKTGLLKRGEESNPDRVQAAKADFQNKFGFSADQTTYRNEDNYNLLQSKDRQDVAAYVQSFYQEVRHAKENCYDYSQIRKTIDDPEIMQIESLDMFTAPHIQQGRITNEQMIDFLIDENVQKKSIDTYVGDSRFWKTIDDAFEPKEVEKIQKHLGDQDPLGFELRPGKVELEFNKDGKVIDVHQKQ